MSWGWNSIKRNTSGKLKPDGSMRSYVWKEQSFCERRRKRQDCVFLVTKALFSCERLYFGSVRVLHPAGMCCGRCVCMGRVCTCVWWKHRGVARVGLHKTQSRRPGWALIKAWMCSVGRSLDDIIQKHKDKQTI